MSHLEILTHPAECEVNFQHTAIGKRFRQCRVSRQQGRPQDSQLAFANVPGVSNKLRRSIRLWNDEVCAQSNCSEIVVRTLPSMCASALHCSDCSGASHLRTDRVDGQQQTSLLRRTSFANTQVYPCFSSDRAQHFSHRFRNTAGIDPGPTCVTYSWS